jgi:glucosamine--fructose-6-phosphate aminotransferase (isomerizing)
MKVTLAKKLQPTFPKGDPMTKPAGAYTLAEIRSQPQSWLAALDVLSSNKNEIEAILATSQPDEIIFTGCGSTYYLSLAAAALVTELGGIPARALPASELWFYPQSAYPKGKKTLLVAVSRSGETTETLRACEKFLKEGRGTLLTLSCYGERELASIGALNLVFPSGMEESVAQTRAFSTLYLGCIALAALWGKQAELYANLPKLAAPAQNIIANSHELARSLGASSAIDRFYFLGSGSRHGLACELSLKMKEMSLSHSEPFHFMEFRHGPKSMITPSALVVALLSEGNRAQEDAVVREMSAMGAQVLTIAEKDAMVEFNGGLPETLQNILYLPVGQLLGFERSLSKGLDPDRPNNLDAVVRLS